MKDGFFIALYQKGKWHTYNFTAFTELATHEPYVLRGSC
jgi:hypothetical protein